jgi:hypothetical protein
MNLFCGEDEDNAAGGETAQPARARLRWSVYHLNWRFVNYESHHVLGLFFPSYFATRSMSMVTMVPHEG